MPIAIGSKAPDFTLKTVTPEGLKDVKLSDKLGTKKTMTFKKTSDFSIQFSYRKGDLHA